MHFGDECYIYGESVVLGVKTFPEEGPTTMESEMQVSKEHRRQTKELNFD
jgi:hypothetical protein